jgi:hypothetical protein
VPPGTDLGAGEAHDGLMYGSLGSESARLRIDDQVRAAEAYRHGRKTRRGAAEVERSRAKGVGRTLLAALLSPIRH